jgi:hypothetical protein
LKNGGAVCDKRDLPELRVALFWLVSVESEMVITAEAFMNMFGIGLARA